MIVKKKIAFVICVLVILVSAFSLSSCDHRHDQKALADLYSKTRYDTSIIQHLSQYDRLKDVLVTHLDTIFKFRDANTNVYHGNDEITHEKHDFFLFFFNRNSGHGKSEDDISLKTLPATLYPAIQQFGEVLGRDKINGFSLWTDSTFEIVLPIGYIDEKTKATVLHKLRWKREVDLSGEPFAKDTIIAPGWRYEIDVFEYEDKSRMDYH
jgi:hypothetical protein